MPTNPPSTATWMRRRRDELSLTQAALARQVGCAPDVLRKIESGAKRPSRQLAERIAGALGLEAAERAAFVEAVRAPRPVHPDGVPAAALPVSAPPTMSLTKLLPPRVRGVALPRPRLYDTLRHSLGHTRLVLISAPAGAGKTTLLSSALAASAAAVAWLTLEADDSHPLQFLSALVAALRQALPSFGTGADALLAAPRLADTSAIRALSRQVVGAVVNELLRHPALVIVLDDLHVIDDPEALVALDQLIERLPEHVVVAVATRADPPLSLARLRARNELLELRFAELRFTLDEATALLDGLPFRLARHEVSALLEHTEGWAAGLNLLTASLRRIESTAERRDFLHRLAQTDRYVFEYLAEEVLSREDPFVRMFLLESAVLPELTPEACCRLTGIVDAAAILDDLYRRNLFLIAVERADGTMAYRYHDLFATFLRARLTRELPEWTRELHRRAAVAEQVPARRIHHLLRAECWDLAAQAIEQTGEALVAQGTLAGVRSWIEAVPDAERRARPRLSALLGLCALQVWELDTATEQLERALAGFIEAGDRASQGEMLAQLAVCHGAMGDVAAARLATERALTLPGPSSRRAQLLIGRAWQSLAAGAWQRANADLDAAFDLVERERDLRALHALTVNYHSPFSVLPGGMARIERLHRLVRSLAPDSDFLLAAADAQRAWLLFWRNEWDEARRLCRHLLAVDEDMRSLFGSTVEAGVILPMCDVLDGDPERAEPAIGALLDALARPEAATWTRSWGPGFLYIVGRLRWHSGQIDAARALYARLCAARHANEWPHVAALREAMSGLLLLSDGDPAEAVRAFEAAATRQQASLLPLLYSDMRLLLAYGYLELGRPEQALRELAPALDEHLQAGTPGRVRAEGPRVAVPLLRLAARNGVHAAFANALLAAMGERPAAHGVSTAAVPTAGEPLTPREVDVLRLMITGAGNAAIAEQLTISIHTVKTHVSNLLAKLGAATRAEAAALARQLNLV